MNDAAIDERLLENVTWYFPENVGLEEIKNIHSRQLAFLQSAGLQTAQNLIDIGCLVLFDRVVKIAPYVSGKSPAAWAFQFLSELRLLLPGTGICLRCDVPEDRFCLVHNTIGGGGTPHFAWRGFDQEAARKYCMRMLSPDEQKHAAAMHAGQKRIAQKNLEPFGATVVAEESAPSQEEDESTTTCVGDVCPVPDNSVVGNRGWVTGVQSTHPACTIPACDHVARMNTSCRSCLARAVLEAPLPRMKLILQGCRGNSESVFEYIFSGEEIDLEACVQEKSVGGWESALVTICIGRWRRGALTRVK